MAEFEHLLVKRDGDTVRITMNRAARRNSLSYDHLTELRTAFDEAGASDATGIVLAGEGPVFSAGHDFADVAARDLVGVRDLLVVCTELMHTIQSVPQVVIARVHGLATAAGCQLVASCDLAVAAESAGFALPGGKGGWFCHTPAVPARGGRLHDRARGDGRGVPAARRQGGHGGVPGETTARLAGLGLFGPYRWPSRSAITWRWTSGR